MARRKAGVEFLKKDAERLDEFLATLREEGRDAQTRYLVAAAARAAHAGRPLELHPDDVELTVDAFRVAGFKARPTTEGH